jgi:hypothetical protein
VLFLEPRYASLLKRLPGLLTRPASEIEQAIVAAYPHVSGQKVSFPLSAASLISSAASGAKGRDQLTEHVSVVCQHASEQPLRHRLAVSQFVHLIALLLQATSNFFVSLPLYNASIEIATRSAVEFSPVNRHLRRSLRAFWAGDLQMASDAFSILARWRPRRGASDNWVAALRYLALWTEGTTDTFSHLSSDYAHLLRSSAVQIVAPGPRSSDGAPSNARLAIVLSANSGGLGQTSANASTDDLLYVNGDAGEFLLSQEHKTAHALTERYAYRSVKKPHRAQSLRAHTGLEWRAISGAPRFFLRDPNMAPLMVFDLLTHNVLSLRLSGATFFVGGYARKGYTPRWSHSEGAPQNVISSIAQHDVLANRRFVQNLYLAGRLTADASTKHVLKMSDSVYLAQLESSFVGDR